MNTISLARKEKIIDSSYGTQSNDVRLAPSDGRHARRSDSKFRYLNFGTQLFCYCCCCSSFSPMSLQRSSRFFCINPPPTFPPVRCRKNLTSRVFHVFFFLFASNSPSNIDKRRTIPSLTDAGDAVPCRWQWPAWSPYLVDHPPKRQKKGSGNKTISDAAL